MNILTEQRVNHAKTKTEKIAYDFFEGLGYIVDTSTKKQDFDGIDLFVCNTFKKTIKCIDVKCPSEKNQNTNNFSFTIVSKTGKSYIEKINDYFAFIDIPTNTITIIDFDSIVNIVKDIPLKSGEGKSKYVLINKNLIKKNGSVYDLTTRQKVNIE